MPLLSLLLILACHDAPPLEVTVAPPPRTNDPGVVRFVAIGDTGKGNATQRQVARAVGAVCAERGCDFLLLLGDNVYPRGMRSPDDPRIDALVTDVYGDLGLPVYAVLGNHDWGRGGDLAAAASQVEWAREHPFVRMPDRYYRFTAGPAAFFALDTTPVFFGADEAQIAWLGEALAGADAPWKVVVGHHTFRSNGEHGNAGAYEGLAWVPIVRGAPLRRMFEAHVCPRADLYVSGHDHLLQWITHCDTELVVSGAGATAGELVDRGNDPNFAAAEHGLAWIELGAELVVAFHGEDGQLLFEGRRPRPSPGTAPTN